MSEPVKLGLKPLHAKKGYEQLEAEIATLDKQLKESQAKNDLLNKQLIESQLINDELRERNQQLLTDKDHNDKPRSPMCS